ncbi:flagellar hook-length control protein FliK [Aliiruegeria haliotis]|uniref:Flagellar hook-length control protein FliK n=2 Tax=Aliiruegeria haliotis TaxID=1280846 RepID=A0A2T0RE97_9RHOB|nr:flagellar hook-length control protein FliK [Aliiruegeria haliotis]
MHGFQQISPIPLDALGSQATEQSTARAPGSAPKGGLSKSFHLLVPLDMRPTRSATAAGFSLPLACQLGVQIPNVIGPPLGTTLPNMSQSVALGVQIEQFSEIQPSLADGVLIVAEAARNATLIHGGEHLETPVSGATPLEGADGAIGNPVGRQDRLVPIHPHHDASGAVLSGARKNHPVAPVDGIANEIGAHVPPAQTDSFAFGQLEERSQVEGGGRERVLDDIDSRMESSISQGGTSPPVLSNEGTEFAGQAGQIAKVGTPNGVDSSGLRTSEATSVSVGNPREERYRSENGNSRGKDPHQSWFPRVVPNGLQRRMSISYEAGTSSENRSLGQMVSVGSAVEANDPPSMHTAADPLLHGEEALSGEVRHRRENPDSRSTPNSEQRVPLSDARSNRGSTAVSSPLGPQATISSQPTHSTPPQRMAADRLVAFAEHAVEREGTATGYVGRPIGQGLAPDTHGNVPYLLQGSNWKYQGPGRSGVVSDMPRRTSSHTDSPIPATDTKAVRNKSPQEVLPTDIGSNPGGLTKPVVGEGASASSERAKVSDDVEPAKPLKQQLENQHDDSQSATHSGEFNTRKKRGHRVDETAAPPSPAARKTGTDSVVSMGTPQLLVANSVEVATQQRTSVFEWPSGGSTDVQLVASDLSASTSASGSRGATGVPYGAESMRNIAPQIVEALQHQHRGILEIRLNPEELGRLQITFANSDSGMQIVINPERSETIDLVRRNLDVLSNELKDLGFEGFSLELGHSGAQDTPDEDGDEVRTMSRFQGSDDYASSHDAHMESNGSTGLRAGLDLRV